MGTLVTPPGPPVPPVSCPYPEMLVVETLLERDKEGRPRRGPSSVCRKLSEG